MASFSVSSPSTTTKIQSQILFESPLLKKGKYGNTFKEKWFVLLENRILIYYSSETKATHEPNSCDGSISLKDVNNLTITHTANSNNNNNKQKNSVNKLLSSSKYVKTNLVRKSSTIDQIRISDKQQHSQQQNNSYAVQLDLAHRSYTFGSNNTQQFKQWILYLEQMIFGGIIHSGFLCKQGGKWKSWKKRWFILDASNLLLKYYETQKLKMWKGAIDLSTVTNLCRGDKETNGKDFSIELNTNDRVWILAANDANERDLWIDKIKKVMDEHVITKKDQEFMQKMSEKTGVLRQRTYSNESLEQSFEENEPSKTLSVNIPKAKGVRFSNDPKLISTPSPVRSDEEEEYSVYSMSETVQIHKQSMSTSKQHAHNNTLTVGHQRLNTRISIVVTSADEGSDVSDSSEYSNSSLDEYDGSLMASSLNPIDSDEEFEIFKPQTISMMNQANIQNVDLYGDDDTSMGPTPLSGSECVDSPTVSRIVHSEMSPTPNALNGTPINPTSPHSLSRGYKYRGLKSQFVDVRNIDLNTTNYQYDDDHDDMNGGDESSDSSVEMTQRSRNYTWSEYEDEQKGKMAKNHQKTKSALRQVQFDERFKVILKKKKKKTDMKNAEKILTKQWNEIIQNLEMDMTEEANMKFEDMRIDNCVSRICVVLQFYHLWLYNSSHKVAINEYLSKLNGFDFVCLCNDFYHIKRDYADQSVYLKLYFMQQTSVECDIENCVMLLRCNRDKVQMATDFLLRRQLYFLSSTKVKGDEETYEVVLQQLLDSIYAFIFYGEYFAANDKVKLGEAMNEYEQNKKFKNILYKYKNFESMTQGNKFCSSINFEHQLAKAHDDNKNNIFGVNMRYGTRIEWYYLQRYQSYHDTMKDELMNHRECEISSFQWADMIKKADVYKKTFIGKILSAKKPNENERSLCENRHILDIHIIALVFYSHFNRLKKALLDSYHILSSPPIQQNEFSDQLDKDKDDIQSYTRQKHYNIFFHFGRLILESVKVFGQNLYSTECNSLSTFYHGVNVSYQSVISWKKFAYNTFGPMSVTTKPIVSFLHNDNRESTVLELDLNGGTLFSQYVYCFDLSFLSDCHYEYECLLDGGLCLGIRNIISLKHIKNNGRYGKDYYLWMESIFLLRILVGDIYWKVKENIDSYFIHELAQNELICDRLHLLIVNELEFDIDDTDSHNDVPKYVRRIFHAFCDNFVGYAYVDLDKLCYLGPKLKQLFLLNEYECINCKFLLELFPNINFIHGYNFIFDDTFCNHIVQYLNGDERKNRLMYIQFEMFTRQKQINSKYFKEEIIPLCQKFRDQLTTDWDLRKSAKFELVKFGNKKLIRKYTVPLRKEDKGKKKETE